MSCILRISGKNLNIYELLDIGLEPDNYWVKGDPSGKKHLKTGVNYCVSDADFNEFELQKKDAFKYLQNNKKEIKAIHNLAGCENGHLDFGIEQRDEAVQCNTFSPKLIKLIGELDLGIEVSLYPILKDY